MNFRRVRTIILVSAAVAAAAACKDDDDETVSLPSLDGTPEFSIPEYIEAESEWEMTPKKVTHPEDGAVGYYWKVSPDMETNDTTLHLTQVSGDDPDGKFTHKFTENLRTHTVSCVAFASGYYTSSYSASVTTVKSGDGGSIQNAGFTGSDETFTDPRDDKTYRITTIGNTVWFRQNLAYEGSDGETLGFPYKDAEAMTDIFGMYYTWENAMKACPDGWELPSEDDWVNLAKSCSKTPEGIERYEDFAGLSGKIMADATFNGTTMWEYWPKVQITNETQLSVIPTGFANIAGNSKDFIGTFEYAMFWTSDEISGSDVMALCRYIYCDNPAVTTYAGNKSSFATPVRCVRYNTGE